MPVSARRSASVGQPRGQLQRRLGAPRARVLHVVRLVQHQRARLAPAEALGVGLEDVVVEDHDLGASRPPRSRRRRCARRAPPRVRSRQPVLALALPHQLHARRADHHGREGVVGLERGERLHGLAEPLLVGDERAAALERVAHACALEGVQLAAELEVWRSASSAYDSATVSARAVVLADQLVQQRRARARRRGPRGARPRSRRAAAPAPGRPEPPRPRAASRSKKRPARGTGCASGSRRKSPRRAPGPSRSTRVSSGSPSSPISSVSSAAAGVPPSSSSRAPARARSSSSHALQLRQPRGAASAEREHERDPRPRPRRAQQLVGRLAGDRAQDERARALVVPTDTSARQRSESLSQASTSAVGSSAGKLLQHVGHELRRRADRPARASACAAS